jgi:diguanylate cyclase (GGDEF)-like protein
LSGPSRRCEEWEKEAEVRGNPRILVIGASVLGGAVARALPRCRVVTTGTLLSGLWTAGHEDFDVIALSLACGPGVPRAIRSLRQVAPRARIVMSCAACDEPRAREALQAGADDYVLEPLVPDELAAACRLLSHTAPLPVATAPLPSMEEILELSEVLKNLGAGLHETLARLAVMLRQVFQAESVALRVGEHTACEGSSGPAVLEEPLRRGDEVVGTIALGPRARTSYLASDAARLANYARLIETIVAQATEQARWRDLAWHDDLSGLRNRRYFETTLDRLIGQAAAQRFRVTVILLDIDDFKSYNDRYGHETGDGLIREVAVLLTSCSREHDVVARYGGDEFAVIIWDAEQPRVPGSKHPTDPAVLAERFEGAMRRHAFKCLGHGAPGPVTFSGGLACFPWDGQTRVEILRAADAALLTAKRSGKNHILLADKAATSDSPGAAAKTPRAPRRPEPEGD